MNEDKDLDSMQDDRKCLPWTHEDDEEEYYAEIERQELL